MSALNALGNLHFSAARQQGYAPCLTQVRANDIAGVFNRTWHQIEGAIFEGVSQMEFLLPCFRACAAFS